MLLKADKFGGIYPAIAPHLLTPPAADKAVNLDLSAGDFRPWRGLKQAPGTLGKAGPKLTLARYFGLSGRYWLHWLEDVDVVSSPLADDKWERVYWTGEAEPRMAGNDIIVSTPGVYPSDYRVLGVPAPTVTPTLEVIGEATDEDPTMAERWAYLVTYRSKYGEEGPPCPSSEIVTVQPGQGVALSGLPGSISGKYDIDEILIYRFAGDSEGSSEPLLVTILPIDTETYEDTKLTRNLAIITMQSAGWDPPPVGLSGLKKHPAGFLFGHSGTDLYFSVPWRPHAWPESYRIPVGEEVVSCGLFGGSILVTTKNGFPVVVSGDTPGEMSIERLEKGEACVSARGTVDLGYAVVYPSANGLWAVGVEMLEPITEGVIDNKSWKALKPETIRAFRYGSLYVAFSEDGGFVYDPKNKRLSLLNGVGAKAGAYDDGEGALYLVSGDKVVVWNGSQVGLSGLWRSCLITLGQPENFGAAQIIASAYPVTFSLYADDGTVIVDRVAVSSSRPFRLPGGILYERVAIEVESSEKISSVAIGRTVDDLNSN